jgi:hypothetical protein
LTPGHRNSATYADTALRLGDWFDISPEFWLNLQKRYEAALQQCRNAEGFLAEVGRREGLTWAAQARYANPVKNITVSVDDETYRRARTKAAERDTSLSALVRRFLVELVSEESSERGLERQERDPRAQIRDFTAGDRLSREDAHGRRE